MNFCPDQNKWKHKLLPSEVSKSDPDRASDLLIYKNHYVLFQKLNVLLGDHYCIYVCGRCLNCYTCQNMIVKHKEKCEQKQEITTIRTSDESHLYWKDRFRKNPIYFRLISDFEAESEIDNSSTGNKTTTFYKENSVRKG